jgi:hypothetical protein
VNIIELVLQQYVDQLAEKRENGLKALDYASAIHQPIHRNKNRTNRNNGEAATYQKGYPWRLLA